MRLINVDTLEMRYFLDDHIPEYAILSHRWINDEILFEDYQAGRKLDSLGYKKVEDFCDLVKKSHLQELVNKRSSAELSETINSMFQYYKNAAICIAQIPEVMTLPCREADETQQLPCDSACQTCSTLQKQFVTSPWFERGWTLQELPAPKVVLFVNARWQAFGYKSDAEVGHGPKLEMLLTEITGIPTTVLQHPDFVQDRSVAHRMKWISKRKTTRTEDMAYCLLGILDVNMPLLYGEGDRAWTRLQQEVIRTSSDESIFAWGLNERLLGPLLDGAIFADTPWSFSDGPRVARSETVHRMPYSSTNQGIRWQLAEGEAFSAMDPEGTANLAIPLNCSAIVVEKTYRTRVLIVQRAFGCDHWCRVWVRWLGSGGMPRTLRGQWSACKAQTIHIHDRSDQCRGNMYAPREGSTTVDLMATVLEDLDLGEDVGIVIVTRDTKKAVMELWDAYRVRVS